MTRKSRRVRTLTALVIWMLALGSCAREDPSPPGEPQAQSPSALPTSPQLPALPADQDIYSLPPELPAGDPGRLLRTQSLHTPEGISGWRVLYHSQALDGRDVVVSGLIFAPEESTGADLRPVVAWAHGTVGLGDACAPSRSPDDLLAQPLLSELVARGYVVTATDYEGLGTPGSHPWLVGLSEGRSVLDSVRAAAQIPQVRAGRQFLAVGASQGGGAALFAGELAPSYAEELELLGVVAAAPAAELDLLALLPDQGLEGLAGYLVMGALGFKAAYPDLDLRAIMSEEAVAQREQVEALCQPDIQRRFAAYPVDRLLVSSPADVPDWAAAIAENTPGRRETPAPVFLVHGDQDRVVPPVVSRLLLQRMCALGVSAHRKEYLGVGHGTVMAASAGDVLGWIDDLAEGRAPATVGQGCS